MAGGLRWRNEQVTVTTTPAQILSGVGDAHVVLFVADDGNAGTLIIGDEDVAANRYFFILGATAKAWFPHSVMGVMAQVDMDQFWAASGSGTNVLHISWV